MGLGLQILGRLSLIDRYLARSIAVLVGTDPRRDALILTSAAAVRFVVTAGDRQRGRECLAISSRFSRSSPDGLSLAFSGVSEARALLGARCTARIGSASSGHGSHTHTRSALMLLNVAIVGYIEPFPYRYEGLRFDPPATGAASSWRFTPVQRLTLLIEQQRAESPGCTIFVQVDDVRACRAPQRRSRASFRLTLPKPSSPPAQGPPDQHRPFPGRSRCRSTDDPADHLPAVPDRFAARHEHDELTFQRAGA